MGSSARPVGRRVLLRAAVGGPLAAGVLAGCRFTDPVIHSDRHNTGVSPTPEPTPDPEQLVAADQESSLASQLSLLVGAPGVASSVRQWASAAAHAHLLAAQVLTQLDPFTVPPGSPATTRAAVQPSAASALTAVQTSSTALALAHRERARAAQEPALAMLWSSLLVTATSQSKPTAPLVERPTRPHRADPGSAAEADDVLVERLHATIQGYEIGVARLPFSDVRRAGAEGRLAALVQLRDQHSAAIRDAGGDPPGPRPGYQQPIRPSTASQALGLFVLLERALLDALARRVAARSGQPRDQALTDLLAQVPHCQAWGGAIVLWPGWP